MANGDVNNARYALEAAYRTEKRRVLATLELCFPELALSAESATLKGRRHGNLVAAASRVPLPLDQVVRRAAGSAFPFRVLLVVAGRVRPGADRLPLMHGDPRPRGAIRASLPDWLSVSPYADQIVALRPAHISHGGGGAVYVILRRSRED